MTPPKSMTLLGACLALASLCFAQDEPKEGIHWLKNTEGVTFAQVKAEAKAEGKAIFMDFYTKWCGPCRSMDERVFPQKAIGDYYNSRFVNFKVDAEVGEGVELMATYQVTGFPSFIYTDAEGEVLREGSSIGYGDVEGMLELAKLSLGEAEEKPWSWFEEQYAGGNRELAFLSSYVKAQLKYKHMPPSLKLKEELYLATPENERFREGMEAYDLTVWNALPGNLFYEVLIENRDKFQKQLGDRISALKLLDQMLMKAEHAMDEGQLPKDEIHARIEKDFPQLYPVAARGQEIDRLRFSAETRGDAYVKAYVAWVDENDLPFDFNGFGVGGSVLSMKELTPEIAERALVLYKEGVDGDPPHFYSVHAYCYLLYKSGQQDEACAEAKRFAELTASFESSKKMVKPYAVMKALEAGEDPTPAMLKEYPRPQRRRP